MRYCLMTESEALDGRDEVLAAWIDNEHFADLLSVPGFISAERFLVQSAEAGPAKHLCLYEVETSDLPGMFAEVQRRREAGLLPAGAAQKPGSVRTTVCKSATPKVLSQSLV